jgi:flagellar biosynthesis repressor protein FlbT
MSLKLNLKADEKIIIGGAVLRNGPRHAELYVENSVPILRQKDIMTEEEAQSPARRIYFLLQLMYIDAENRPAYQESLGGLMQEVVAAAPSTQSYLVKIVEEIAAGRLYQALKSAHQLIDYEKELFAHAGKPA